MRVVDGHWSEITNGFLSYKTVVKYHFAMPISENAPLLIFNEREESWKVAPTGHDQVHPGELDLVNGGLLR